MSSAQPAGPIRLWNTSADRERIENLADLYAILVTAERLEKQYIRDNIPPAEYTPACSKLITQFRTALSVVHDQISSVDQFMRDYNLSCPLAVNRLVKIGVPATVEHASADAPPDRSATAKHVAETVQHFITLMDAVKLGMVAVDQLHPMLSDLLAAMNKGQGRAKIREWLIALNQMKASDELSEDQARQLHFDLESAHAEFYRGLQ
ncbi:vacuolar protein sorting-associated [Blastocladiella britannica]|nr:vacuolar protein sorting-associated [Blastocladiella britannica]